jgi:hypothetical protein
MTLLPQFLRTRITDVYYHAWLLALYFIKMQGDWCSRNRTDAPQTHFFFFLVSHPLGTHILCLSSSQVNMGKSYLWLLQADQQYKWSSGGHQSTVDVPRQRKPRSLMGCEK